MCDFLVDFILWYPDKVKDDVNYEQEGPYILRPKDPLITDVEVDSREIC